MLPVILRVTVDDHSTVLSMTVSRDGTAILNTWADDVDEIAWNDILVRFYPPLKTAYFTASLMFPILSSLTNTLLNVSDILIYIDARLKITLIFC